MTHHLGSDYQTMCSKVHIWPNDNAFMDLYDDLSSLISNTKYTFGLTTSFYNGRASEKG